MIDWVVLLVKHFHVLAELELGCLHVEGLRKILHTLVLDLITMSRNVAVVDLTEFTGIPAERLFRPNTHHGSPHVGVGRHIKVSGNFRTAEDAPLLPPIEIQGIQIL